MEDDEFPLLVGKEDHYGGIIVDSEQVPRDQVLFGKSLERSLSQWKNGKKRGIWLKLTIDRAHLISIAVDLGFVFHHAERDFVMLTRWLPEDAPNTLPLHTTHTIGVGGCVMNSKQEILVVQEKNGPITGFWKFPGGMVEPGEDIWEAIVREVKEETGIECEFVTIVAIREHVDKKPTGETLKPANLYCTCVLRPLTEKIALQESEIAKCEWMSVDQYLEYQNSIYGSKSGGTGVYQAMIRMTCECARSILFPSTPGAQTSVRAQGFIHKSLPIGFIPGNNTVYYVPSEEFENFAKL